MWVVASSENEHRANLMSICQESRAGDAVSELFASYFEYEVCKIEEGLANSETVAGDDVCKEKSTLVFVAWTTGASCKERKENVTNGLFLLTVHPPFVCLEAEEPRRLRARMGHEKSVSRHFRFAKNRLDGRGKANKPFAPVLWNASRNMPRWAPTSCR
ncbi:hypothetical protein TRVL_01925 [Trypanosoma vivax]|nr:hypothetical protein TRVL_01925 [Trypanosoma vivax]